MDFNFLNNLKGVIEVYIGIVTLKLCEVPVERQPCSPPCKRQERSSQSTGANIGRKRMPPTHESRLPTRGAETTVGRATKCYKIGILGTLKLAESFLPGQVDL